MNHKIYKITILVVLLASMFSLTAQAAPLYQISSFTPVTVTQTETYSNGDQYTGQFLNGKYNGTGTYTWANGDRYEGQFADGQISGQGRLTFFGNGQYWEGTFVNGQISTGTGVFYWGSNGDKFDGTWINGVPDGTGVLLHSNGTSNQVTYTMGTYVSTSGVTAGGNDTSTLSQWSTGYSYNPFSGVQVGSTVSFGSYEQDNNYNNGKESISWKVLAINNGRALLLSQYLLDALPYNYQQVPMTWENSWIRSWLNQTFYNDAFSAQEKAYISQSWISNPKSAAFGTNGGNNTYDNLFLLSQDEIYYYFPSEASRKASPTAVARSHGAYGTADKNCAWWWLRSPGQSTYCASSINSIGVLLNTGPLVNDTTGGIRPAMWVNIN